MKKQWVIPVVIAAMVFLVKPGFVYALWPLPRIILPTPTPTPTPTPAFRLFIPSFRPFFGASPTPSVSPSPTPTVSPTPSPTVTPAITGSPLPTATFLPSPAGTVQPLSTASPQPTESAGLLAGVSLQQVAAVSIISLLVLVILLQSQWSKIKGWFHKKTE